MKPISALVAIAIVAQLVIAAVMFRGLHGPQITVVMPKDAQPLAQLDNHPTITISSDRAVLYWTVFKNMSDRGYDSTATMAAQDAVDKVYGPIPQPARAP